ncbi:MAG: hypothetical protein M3N82_08270, partial [Pseudomonadota bacterium]|nr:hypothetical protein [Pseudomonadota bacterium]
MSVGNVSTDRFHALRSAHPESALGRQRCDRPGGFRAAPGQLRALRHDRFPATQIVVSADLG